MDPYPLALNYSGPPMNPIPQGPPMNTAFPLPEPMTLAQMREAALRVDPTLRGTMLSGEPDLAKYGNEMMDQQLKRDEGAVKGQGEAFNQALEVAREKRLQQQSAIQAQTFGLRGQYQPTDLYGLPGAFDKRTGTARVIPPPGGTASPEGTIDFTSMPQAQREQVKAYVLKKLPAPVQAHITSAEDVLARVGPAMEAVNRRPQAFGFGTGLASMVPGETLGAIVGGAQNYYRDPEDTAARSLVFEQAYRVIKEMAGTALSKNESARVDSFAPSQNDKPEDVKRKLAQALQYAQESRARNIQEYAPLLGQLEQADAARAPGGDLNLGTQPVPAPRLQPRPGAQRPAPGPAAPRSWSMPPGASAAPPAPPPAAPSGPPPGAVRSKSGRWMVRDPRAPSGWAYVR